MLVSGGNIFHHGRRLGLGDPIEDPENWRGQILQIHLSTGAILDVTPEKAEELRGVQKKKDIRALGQTLMRTHQRAKRGVEEATGQVRFLSQQLKDAQKSLEASIEAEGEAADKLEAARERYSDLGLGFEPEPAPETSVADIPQPSEPTAEEQTSALPPDELRAQAIAAVGGFTRNRLVKRIKEWWEIDVYGLKAHDDTLLIPKGSKKQDIVDAAIAIYEARYRLSETLVEGGPVPDEAVLLAVSLGAVNAVVPSEATEALRQWAAVDEPEPEPELEQVPGPDLVESPFDEFGVRHDAAEVSPEEPSEEEG